MIVGNKKLYILYKGEQIYEQKDKMQLLHYAQIERKMVNLGHTHKRVGGQNNK